MNTIDILKSGLKELNITLTDPQISDFMTYLSELKKWNRAYNMTSLRTDKDIVVKHFLDSLLYISAFPDRSIKCADVGTGAGFPGVPIKIVRPETHITLVESSRKKTAFLRNIIRCLRLTGIEVLEQRIENLGIEYENAFDVMVSRATFSMKEFITKACPYVQKKGILILNKGPKVSGELRALEASAFPGGAVKEMLRLSLPLTHVQRNLAVLSCTMEK